MLVAITPFFVAWGVRRTYDVYRVGCEASGGRVANVPEGAAITERLNEMRTGGGDAQGSAGLQIGRSARFQREVLASRARRPRGLVRAG